MHSLDWLVLFGTLLAIVAYGTWRSRKNRDLDNYLRGGNDLRWFGIGLSVMATQASAITFLSAPGLGYESGLRFVQFYFGLPLALILVSAFAVPIYYRLKVYTAYEFLENRFDLKTRLLAAGLFLIQRGLAAGLTIFAPAIILSTLLHWNLNLTCLLVGSLVIIYTVSGGSKAVSITQKWQMGVIMLGLALAFSILLIKIQAFTDIGSALALAGTAGRMEVMDFSFDLNERYTVWSGLTGGLFLALSYFGTDQSQVQRYLGGRSSRESRLGLMFNALLKIPMQFFILFIGVLVFVFYLFVKPPMFFNEVALDRLAQQGYATEIADIQERFDDNYRNQQETLLNFEVARAAQSARQESLVKAQLRENLAMEQSLRGELRDLMLKADPEFKVKDTNYVFLTFVMDYLPVGVVGLILALIFSAAMSSTSSELNALATTSAVDFYYRLRGRPESDRDQVKISQWLTVFWGALAIIFSLSASLFDNLIEMVNVLGSLFYGTILGIFITAFFLKKVGARSLFPAALVGQALVLILHFGRTYEWSWMGQWQVEYLWYNVIAGLLVPFLAWLGSARQKKSVAS